MKICRVVSQTKRENTNYCIYLPVIHNSLVSSVTCYVKTHDDGLLTNSRVHKLDRLTK